MSGGREVSGNRVVGGAREVSGDRVVGGAREVSGGRENLQKQDAQSKAIRET